MAKQNTQKRRIVTSFHNLTPELQEAVKAEYPLGFSEAMLRVDKPNGDFFYAVPYDTEEVAYLVKIDVKIDDKPHEEEEKDYYYDELKDEEELAGSDEETDSRADDDVQI